MRFDRIVLFLLSIFLILSPFAGCRIATAATTDVIESSQASLLDELTFLGDSTTAHMQLRSSLRKEQVWAAKNRYLNLDSRIAYAKIVAPDTGEEELIANVAARLRPRYLVITLGVDYGVYYYRERLDVFRYYYERLISDIQSASPQTRIILQSIFPVGRSSSVITNEMIRNANAVICALARDRALCFVDQTPVLTDKEGYLRDEYCYSEDGIHLTEAAYTAILSHLTTLELEIRG